MVGSRLRFPLLTILLLTGVTASGQRFEEPVHGLAQKIAAVVKPHPTVTLSFRNVSSLSAVDAALAQAAMERELRALGVAAGEQRPGGTTQIKVTL